MKKILLAGLLTLLSSCALIDAYRMARFDNNEYMLINRVRTQASIGVTKCGTPEVVEYVNGVYYKSIELKNYSASIPENKETVKMTSALAEITKGLQEKYQSGDEVSQAYCNLKFGTIEKNAVTIQTVIGAKPR